MVVEVVSWCCWLTLLDGDWNWKPGLGQVERWRKVLAKVLMLMRFRPLSSLQVLDLQHDVLVLRIQSISTGFHRSPSMVYAISPPPYESHVMPRSQPRLCKDDMTQRCLNMVSIESDICRSIKQPQRTNTKNSSLSSICYLFCCTSFPSCHVLAWLQDPFYYTIESVWYLF